MGNDTDFIEIGKGNQSKVIGHNNSISEYGATALSLLYFVGQGSLIAWLVIGGWLYWVGFTFFWSVVIALIITIALTVGFIMGIVKLITLLHDLNTPPQQRNEKGQFVETRPLNRRGKTVKAIKSTDKKNYEVVEVWGRGVDD